MHRLRIMKPFERLSRNAVPPAYRWFPLWLSAGLVMAILLLVNSVANYFYVSRRVQVEQVRRDLAGHVAGVDRNLRRAPMGGRVELAVLLERTWQASNGRIAWVRVDSADGAVAAHAGMEAGRVFSDEFVRAEFRSRRPVFRSMETESGTVVVEAFPVRLPSNFRATLFRTIASAEPAQQLGTIEIAAFLDSANATYWPLQRSLLINTTAALVLLIALSMLGARFRSYLEGRRLEQQVGIARDVQQHLLPPAGAVSPHLELAADSVAASGVTGDFYDVFPASRGSVALALGDVSGKGVPAALLMGVIHGAVRSSAWTGSAAAHEEASGQINRLLCERASSERFATMFWGYFDPARGMLHYVNAGHLAPLLRKAGGRTQRLTEGGPALGLLPHGRYRQGSTAFEPGDLLVLYTDGIVEAANREGEMFGEQRVLEAIESSLERPAQAIRDEILDSVRAFTGEGEIEDDRTLAVITRLPLEAAGEMNSSRERSEAATREIEQAA